jgi:glucose/arabinose dehydrogenase
VNDIRRGEYTQACLRRAAPCIVQLMLSARLLGLAVVAATGFAALGACGSDGGSVVDVPDADPNAEGGPPPTRAEFGLDTRPSNTTCLAQTRPPSTAPVKFDQVFANVNLQAPMMMAQIPGDKTRWFVAQRDGTIVSFPVAAPPSTPTAVGSVPTVSGKTIQTAGEGGLLGFAFHPKFAQNGKLYVTWTTTGAASPANMLSTVGELHSPVQGDRRAVPAAVHEPRRRRHRLRQGRLPLLLVRRRRRE